MLFSTKITLSTKPIPEPGNRGGPAGSSASAETHFRNIFRNGRRQFPEPQQPYRRIDTVIGSSNDNLLTEEPKPMEVMPETIETKTETPVKEEAGFLDSYFGDGAQTRIVGSINNWVVDKAKTNPGCVERFICETYKTGETFEGVPYFLMTLTK